MSADSSRIFFIFVVYISWFTSNDFEQTKRYAIKVNKTYKDKIIQILNENGFTLLYEVRILIFFHTLITNFKECFIIILSAVVVLSFIYYQPKAGVISYNPMKTLVDFISSSFRLNLAYLIVFFFI